MKLFIIFFFLCLCSTTFAIDGGKQGATQIGDYLTLCNIHWNKRTNMPDRRQYDLQQAKEIGVLSERVETLVRMFFAF